MEPTQTFERLVNTWERAYTAIIASKKALIARRKELQTWDAMNDPTERAAKIQALSNLIEKIEHNGMPNT